MKYILPMLGCLILTAITLNGCARIQKNLGAPLPHEAFAEVESGAHYSRVLQLLGPPARISAVPGGSVFLYENRQLTERQWGLTLPGDIGNLFKFIYAKSDASVDVMIFSFDQRGVLLGKSTERLKSNTGGGMALNFIFKVKALADTSAYTTAQQGILDWGMALAQPLPVVLNSPQSLDSGANGVEVIGMESTVGQKTLEMGRDK